MFTPFFGAPEGRPSAYGRGTTPASMRVHRLKAISIALAGSALVSPVAYALDFAEARLIAEQQSPRISAQQLQVNVAESVQKAAGSLPDPKLSLGIENYPISGMDRWFSASSSVSSISRCSTACAAIHARLSSWRICNRCKTSAARSRSTRALSLIHI